ncbi:MAG: T9SS type A sorting domain-containing protein, partial [Deltaproteobacteria bacterium]|nr:T9SS type A sorting domain-containing protein [Deltaproteobacteria bacterium]
ALILQFVVGIIDSFPVDSPISQAAQKYIAGEITIEELDRILQKWGYSSVFKLLGFENQLLQNYPNPFNPETWIPFKLAQSAPVTISIYDTKGQLIRTISLGNRNAGIYTIKDKAVYWDGRDSFGEKVASGIYWYTLQAGEFRATRKLVIMK